MSIEGSPLRNAPGILHADDDYWYRPLTLGENVWNYVAHMPPGGYVRPYPETAKQIQIEFSLYILSGILDVTIRGESARLVPHTALRVPAGDPITMYNRGQEPVSIYMAYTPPPWGPNSPIEERQPVTTLEKLWMFCNEKERKIWSPTVMNYMAGDLYSAQPKTLSEYRQIYKSGQPERPANEDTRERLWVALWEVDGYQLWNKPQPPDKLWFRPMICGDKHFTYVGHIPPGGEAPPSPKVAETIEVCIYTLAGELGCVVLDANGRENRFVLPPHQAFHAARSVPLGFWNSGGQTSSFLLTYSPNIHHTNSIAAFHEHAENQLGRTRVSADRLNQMLGDTLWLSND